MDFNLGIVGEDCKPDPLFYSIISAMNSMKEATADKIYQKIQREEATNYSKPQVDRALASALKYGIFEVKNNRYRVRDDVLDDVDTVYWKMQRKRDQTPFRTQEDINERHMGQKLDPEKDNLRFKKKSDEDSDKEVKSCPQCGRTKRPSSDKRSEVKAKREKKELTNAKNSKSTKNSKGRKRRSKKGKKYEEDDACEEFKSSKSKRNGAFTKPKKGYMARRGKYDTTDESEIDSISLVSDEEQSFGNYKLKNKLQQNDKFSHLDSECDDIISKEENAKNVCNKSSTRVKAESDSDETSLTDELSKSRTSNNFYDSVNYAPKDSGIKDEKYFTARKSYERDEVDECVRKSDWFGYSDDPEGAIIQSNNVLRIEPMDSIAFKGPEHTSYIS